MIENEVLEILNGNAELGERLNSLADQFRGKRDLHELFTLLCSSNNDLVRIGAWITSEIAFELYNTPAFIDRLRELTTHHVSAIRCYALGALYPSLDPEKQDTRDLILRLQKDTNEGVRLSAEAAGRRLFQKRND
jgi:hypothetical protein